MDLMSIRRGLMAQMANGKTLLHGMFTPTEDIASYTIDPGREVTCVLVQCTSNELVSGVRNVGYIFGFVANGELMQYGMASNASGSNWGSAGYWYKTQSSRPITKNGTAITFSPGAFTSGAKFYASRTYEWYAI